MKSLGLIVVITFSIVLFAYAKATSVKSDDEQIMCTQDAMQCADGSWVGRTGAACEFVCPAPKN